MSSLDESRKREWMDKQTASGRTPLSHDGGDGTYGDMERVAKLEARADMTDQRLGRIEDKLDRLLERTGSLPTTNGLWGMVATVIGVGLAISGLTFVIAEWVKG